MVERVFFLTFCPYGLAGDWHIVNVIHILKECGASKGEGDEEAAVPSSGEGLGDQQ